MSFILKAKTQIIESDEIQISYDFPNLYSSMSTDRVIAVILQQLSDD